MSAGSFTTRDTFVGTSGQGTFNQTGGTFSTTSTGLLLGEYAGGSGIFNLSGGSLTTGDAIVGVEGSGTFSQSGGTFSTGGAVLPIGSGGNSSSFNLDGGTLTVGRVQGYTGNVAQSLFNFNGGTLLPAASSTTFFEGLTAASVRSGGALIDTAGFDVTVAQSLPHDRNLASVRDGGLTKLGLGTLTLGGANTYTGKTSLNAGTLSLGGSGALGGGGTLAFGGRTLQFTGANTADYSARFDPAAGQAIKLDTNGQTVTLGTGFSGTGTSLTKLGTGTLILNGANPYTGATAINAGTLLINNQNALGSGGTISFGGGTLQYGDQSHTDAQYNAADFSARFSTADNQPFQVNTNGHSIVYPAGLTGNGSSLTKLGAGTLTLAGGQQLFGRHDRERRHFARHRQRHRRKHPRRRGKLSGHRGNRPRGRGTLPLVRDGRHDGKSGERYSRGIEYFLSVHGPHWQSGQRHLYPDRRHVSANPGSITLGNSAGSNGTFYFSGGSFSVGSAIISSSGNGTVTQTGGPFKLMSFMILGNSADGLGVFDLSGTGKCFLSHIIRRLLWNRRF